MRTAIIALCASATAALGQDADARGGLWPLFVQSFDVFTVVLILGSLCAVAVIVRCVLDIRRPVILGDRAMSRMEELADAGRLDEMIEYARRSPSLVARIVHAAASEPTETPEGMRESAEVVASEQCARWFRRIEPLNVIGNLGPLVGLAGTVWGMILAFQALGSAGGQANPGALSVGISKALFHTLLGLLLAVPCLAVFGAYRGRVDALCNEGLVRASRLVERLIRERHGPREAAAPARTVA